MQRQVHPIGPPITVIRATNRFLANYAPWVLDGVRSMLRPFQRRLMAVDHRRFSRGEETFGSRKSGKPILLLTTTGRSSGLPRTTPLVVVEIDDRVVIGGGAAGSPWEPQWVLNLRADPQAAIERRPGVTEAVRAREAHDEEYDDLFASLCDELPLTAKYQARMDRRLPVFVLEVLSFDTTIIDR